MYAQFLSFYSVYLLYDPINMLKVDVSVPPVIKKR